MQPNTDSNKNDLRVQDTFDRKNPDRPEKRRNIPFFQRTPGLIFAGLTCAFLWGSAPVAIKEAYKAFLIDANNTSSMLLLAGLRFIFAGFLALLAYTIKTKAPPGLKRKQIGKVTGLALLQTTVHYAFYFVGIAKTSGTHASILSGMQSFLLVLIAHFFLRDDKLTPKRTLAIALGATGIVLLNLGGSTVGSTLLGDGLVAVATLMSAASSLLTRRLVQHIEPPLLTGWQLLIGGSLLTLIGLFAGGKMALSLPGLLWFTYLVAVSTVAFSLWSTLLKYHAAPRVGIFMSLAPIVGTLLAELILGENALRPATIIATLLVSAGVFLITTEKKTTA